MSNNLVSDFLAREHDQLGDLETEIITTPNHDSSEPIEIFNNFQSDSENKYESEPDLQQSNGLQEKPSSILVQESEFSLLWRQEFEKKIKEKDEKEAKDKLSLEENAKKELADWYARYEKKIETTKKSSETVATVYSDLTPEELALGKLFKGVPPNKDDPKVWEKVCSMCTMNPLPGKKPSKDTQRMKSILLNMKIENMTSNGELVLKLQQRFSDYSKASNVDSIQLDGSFLHSLTRYLAHNLNILQMVNKLANKQAKLDSEYAKKLSDLKVKIESKNLKATQEKNVSALVPSKGADKFQKTDSDYYNMIEKKLSNQEMALKFNILSDFDALLVEQQVTLQKLFDTRHCESCIGQCKLVKERFDLFNPTLRSEIVAKQMLCLDYLQRVIIDENIQV